jgi:hypothetical protein
MLQVLPEPGAVMGRPTWLTPYGAAWESVLGPGSAPWGQLAKYLKPLLAHYEEAALCARLTAYCTEAGKYAAPARFAATVGLWEPPTAIPQARGDPGPLWVDGWLTEWADLATKP